MEEKIICVLCEKLMKELEWEWNEEDAHKKCVLARADTICSKCGRYFSIIGEDEGCRECGSPMRKITTEDLERLA